MNVGYIDSSFLLSMIFEDNNYDKSIVIWNSLGVLLGSILLEIECRINLYKYFTLQTGDKELHREKENELKKLLQSINRKSVDDEIVSEIQNYKKLKMLKSLDSIHLATANIFNKLINDRLLVCSYDKNMIKVSKEMGMSVI